MKNFEHLRASKLDVKMENKSTTVIKSVLTGILITLAIAGILFLIFTL